MEQKKFNLNAQTYTPYNQREGNKQYQVNIIIIISSNIIIIKTNILVMHTITTTIQAIIIKIIINNPLNHKHTITKKAIINMLINIVKINIISNTIIITMIISKIIQIK